MRKLYLILFVLIISIESVYSQGLMTKAQEYESEYQFLKAIEYYQKALKKAQRSSPDQVQEIYFGLANCYKLINNYELARINYLKSIEKGFRSDEMYLKVGDALLGLCNYNEALQTFKKVLQTPTQPHIESIVRDRIEMTEKALRNENPIPNLKITNMRVFNTEFSEYGVYYNNSFLFYSSMRKERNSSKTDSRTLQGFSDIYYSTNKPGGDPKSTSGTNYQYLDVTNIQTWSQPVELPSPFNNFDYNDGTLAIDFSKNIAYVMQCKGKNGDCHIASIEFTLPFRAKGSTLINLSSETYNIGHPCLTADGKTMYFVSDMPGGYGGTDIWKSQLRSDGNWGQPVNLGPVINTQLDEMFPSLYSDSLLIFASQGHKGYGGLDLYYAHAEKDGSFGKPINFGLPINSGADDFSLLYSKELNGGFFCSDRPGGMGSDDIYYYSGIPFLLDVHGVVADRDTKLPIENAVVIVTVKNELRDTLYTDSEGVFDYKISPGKNYIFDVYKDEYSQNIKTILADNKDVDHIFRPVNKQGYNLNFDLIPNKTGVAIKGKVTDSLTASPLVGQQMILVDNYGYFDQTMTDDEGIYYFGELTDDNSYIVMMTSQGYWTRKKVIDIPKLDRPMTFSSESSYDMDFKAVKVQTDKETVLYNIYYEFDKASLLDSSKFELDKIVQMLKENPNLIVEISAHTDERGNDAYNLNLSQRRAQSVVDYLIKKGIPMKRLVAKGYGESQPVVRNAATELEHQMNRRTAFKVIQIMDQNIELILESIAPKIPIARKGDVRFTNIQEQAYTKPKQDPAASNIVYKVQMAALKTPITDDAYFRKALTSVRGLTIVEEFDNNDKLYKYFTNTYTKMNEAVEVKNQLRSLGYDSFIRIFQIND